MFFRSWSAALGLSCLGVVGACSFASENDDPAGFAGGSGRGGSGQTGGTSSTAGDSGAGETSTGGVGSDPPPGAAVGEACSGAVPCRVGLACENDVCAPGGAVDTGGACVISAECADGGQCVLRVCTAPGEGELGASCASDGDCASGLRCAVVGIALRCAPQGEIDVGGECSLSTECFAGLGCFGGRCAVPPVGLPPFLGDRWAGVECDDPDPNGARAYFEVPGAEDAQEADFFRLPFPTDIRKTAFGLDLTGFPTPGPGLLGTDPVALYVEALSQNDTGWGAYPTVLFRFSGAIDFDTFSEPGPAIAWVDVTEGTPEYGSSAGEYWTYGPGKTAYICHNFLAIRRPQGRPLVPGHTYAVWATTQGKARNGDDIERAENLASVLSNVAPSDTALAPAYEAFAPFRAYLQARNIPAVTILDATVFTVGGVRDSMAELAQIVADVDPPTAGNWVRCADGVRSPCPDREGPRACGPAEADFDEYHALVSLPIFQQGQAPYLTVADGGGIRATTVTRREDVCLALTVPKTPMPAAGYPLVIYGHGTGGSFRDHVRPEVAGALATSSQHFAVLGIDQVEHGPRRGGSDESPDNLFFNFLNPAAARGNPLQGATDQLSLARFAAELDLTPQQTGGGAIRVDATKILFFGHSQGSIEGSLMLPYGDLFKAAVLSGNGASLKDSLRTKTNPVNIASALPIVLQDPSLASPGLADMHPVLGLIQQWIDPADPLNFAAPLARSVLTGHEPKHVFQTYGIGDTFSPPLTLATFVIAGGFELVEHDSSVVTPDPIANLMEQPSGLNGNVTLGTRRVTLGARQYQAPAGSDGHFVVFDVPAANADVVRFLAAAAEGTTPPPIGD